MLDCGVFEHLIDRGGPDLVQAATERDPVLDEFIGEQLGMFLGLDECPELVRAVEQVEDLERVRVPHKSGILRPMEILKVLQITGVGTPFPRQSWITLLPASDMGQPNLTMVSERRVPFNVSSWTK